MFAYGTYTSVILLSTEFQIVAQFYQINKACMITRLELSGDGSHTLYSEKFGQFYHNPKGAVAESLHVFFNQSDIVDRLTSGKDVHILEVGFGSGLNLLLLCDIYAQVKSNSKVCYQSIEAWPIDIETASRLNYGSFMNHFDISGQLIQIFGQLSAGSADQLVHENIHVNVFKGLFGDFSSDKERFHYVFHDAFSPMVNPELWNSQVFTSIYNWCAAGATLTTYCAATAARKAMNDSGWSVSKAPGALGKREMSIARKI